MDSSQHFFGIDVGGTKIELVCFDARLEARRHWRIETPTQRFDEFLAAVDKLVREADAFAGMPGAVGFGLPGIADGATGRHLSANVPALNGQRMAQALAAQLDRPVVIGNDCQCFAVSEANGGAAHGARSMYGLIIGTGAAGGYCLDGKLIRGANGLLGEYGHTPASAAVLEKHGLPILNCACGRAGCLERYVAGPGVSAIHQSYTGQATQPSEIILLADAGDRSAQRTLGAHLDLLASAIGSIVLQLDPHVIVLGGGLSKLAHLYALLPAAVAEHALPGAQVPPIRPPAFGDAGGTRGAAILAQQAWSDPRRAR